MKWALLSFALAAAVGSTGCCWRQSQPCCNYPASYAPAAPAYAPAYAPTAQPSYMPMQMAPPACTCQ